MFTATLEPQNGTDRPALFVTVDKTGFVMFAEDLPTDPTKRYEIENALTQALERFIVNNDIELPAGLERLVVIDQRDVTEECPVWPAWLYTVVGRSDRNAVTQARRLYEARKQALERARIPSGLDVARAVALALYELESLMVSHPLADSTATIQRTLSDIQEHLQDANFLANRLIGKLL